MEIVLASAALDVSHCGEKRQVNDDMPAIIQFGVNIAELNSDIIDIKTEAFTTLFVISHAMKAKCFPFVDRLLQLLRAHLQFKHSREIQETAIKTFK